MARMQVMRFATRAHIEAIFEENHSLWGGPLTLQQYRDYWFSLFVTPWGASNLRYMALTEEEDGPLLSSLKLYRLTGRLFGEPRGDRRDRGRLHAHRPADVRVRLAPRQ
jgi:hypothetical protein